MNDQDLQRSYAVLCESLEQVGSARSELFLTMLCLALMARYPGADAVVQLIQEVRAQCDAEAG